MIYALFLLSFFLDGLFSQYVSLFNPYFSPMLTVLCLILYYPKRKDEKQFFIFAFVIGLLHDITYTHLLFFETTLFISTAIFILFLYRMMKYSYFNVILIGMIVIFWYRLFGYFLYVFLGYLQFHIPLLLRGIVSSFSNLLCLSLFYVVLHHKHVLKWKNKHMV